MVRRSGRGTTEEDNGSEAGSRESWEQTDEGRGGLDKGQGRLGQEGDGQRGLGQRGLGEKKLGQRLEHKEP